MSSSRQTSISRFPHRDPYGCGGEGATARGAVTPPGRSCGASGGRDDLPTYCRSGADAEAQDLRRPVDRGGDTEARAGSDEQEVQGPPALGVGRERPRLSAGRSRHWMRASTKASSAGVMRASSDRMGQRRRERPRAGGGAPARRTWGSDPRDGVGAGRRHRARRAGGGAQRRADRALRRRAIRGSRGRLRRLPRRRRVLGNENGAPRPRTDAARLRPRTSARSAVVAKTSPRRAGRPVAGAPGSSRSRRSPSASSTPATRQGVGSARPRRPWRGGTRGEDDVPGDRLGPASRAGAALGVRGCGGRWRWGWRT